MVQHRLCKNEEDTIQSSSRKPWKTGKWNCQEEKNNSLTKNPDRYIPE